MSFKNSDYQIATNRSDLTSNLQRELGQYFTPPHIAKFMASMFETVTDEISLLDPGAGHGALTTAFIERAISQNKAPPKIHVTAYELDARCIEALQQNLNACHRLCSETNIQFSYTILNEDFIHAAVEQLGNPLFASQNTRFTHIITNPPYRKLKSSSDHRQALSSIGIKTSNLYTAFLSLCIRLIQDYGEVVAITPRSFCNGSYFRNFRIEFLKKMQLRQIHIFESRSAAFSADDVLQENIIMHAKKSEADPKNVIITTSTGIPSDMPKARITKYTDIVDKDDLEHFIHLETDESHTVAKQLVGSLSGSLNELGLSVSTGRVVDFRAKQHLKQLPDATTVPLIYAAHFTEHYIKWPNLETKKPNAIVLTPESADLLVPSGIYVLVKRFSSKEEHRRIVACIFDPALVPTKLVGFENHLNYFHNNGKGISMELARGLAAYLNSKVVDDFFRRFSGHTQVNATDLRNLPYPSLEHLERLGQLTSSNQMEPIDSILERELF